MTAPGLLTANKPLINIDQVASVGDTPVYSAVMVIDTHTPGMADVGDDSEMLPETLNTHRVFESRRSDINSVPPVPMYRTYCEALDITWLTSGQVHRDRES